MSVSAPLSLRPAVRAAPIRTAMVLAAGLGTRMRPLTATRPKPMVEVAGRALLDHVLDRLRAAGIQRAIVNVHYLPEQIEAHLRAVRDIEIIVSDERSLLLETGGGVTKALALIEDESFLIVNSDNLWIDGPVDAIHLLAERWDPAVMDALLLCVPLARAHCHRGMGDFHMAPDGHLTRRLPAKVAPFVFTGVEVASRRMFEGAPAGPFSLNVLFNRAIAAGRLYGLAHQGLWFDVGTPPAVAKTELLLAES